MIAALRRYVIRRRFKALVQSYDDRIEAARKHHKPTRHIEAEKRAFVRACLEGSAMSLSHQRAATGGGSR